MLQEFAVADGLYLTIIFARCDASRSEDDRLIQRVHHTGSSSLLDVVNSANLPVLIALEGHIWRDVLLAIVHSSCSSPGADEDMFCVLDIYVCLFGNDLKPLVYGSQSAAKDFVHEIRQTQLNA